MLLNLKFPLKCLLHWPQEKKPKISLKGEGDFTSCMVSKLLYYFLKTALCSTLKAKAAKNLHFVENCTRTLKDFPGILLHFPELFLLQNVASCIVVKRKQLESQLNQRWVCKNCIDIQQWQGCAILSVGADLTQLHFEKS